MFYFSKKVYNRCSYQITDEVTVDVTVDVTMNLLNRHRNLWC